MSDVPASPAAAPATPGQRLEASLPPWQQSLNRFAENWIFAFIVAMAVRHFVIEAFRIPSASMEPMLYGDPGFSRGDYVVVDKLLFRFTGPSRWGVTVFQFPQPEIEGPGDAAEPAIDAVGERKDLMFVRPLMHRNFVKRALVLPGDRFYIANGDLFLQQKDGSWHIARKPDAVQEAVWETIYDQREASAVQYLPWRGDKGAKVADDAGRLRLDLVDGGAVAFTQPLRNLYLKAGKALVARGPLISDDNGRPTNPPPSEPVEVSMLRPTFTRDGRTGDIWHLDDWLVWRVTSSDLDSPGHGTLLNTSMTEYVGDVRFSATVAALQGEAALRIVEDRVNTIELRLRGDGWRVTLDGAEVASGTDPIVGHAISLANLDDELVFRLDGVVKARHDVQAADPEVNRTGIAWSGAGSLTLAAPILQRDLHYCRHGFLANESKAFERDQRAVDQGPVHDPGEYERAAKELRDLVTVRAQMRGVPVDSLKQQERYEPWGYSPETFITAPAHAYLMLGDNSALSWDGRNWGWVPETNLRGRALAVVLPPTRWHVVH